MSINQASAFSSLIKVARIHLMDFININKLTVSCIIGINPEERTRPQRLEISAQLTLSMLPCFRSGELADSVDYAKVCKDLMVIAIDAKSELLESLANNMCNHIFKAYPKVYGISLTLTKPDAVVNCAGVGITVK